MAIKGEKFDWLNFGGIMLMFLGITVVLLLIALLLPQNRGWIAPFEQLGCSEDFEPGVKEAAATELSFGVTDYADSLISGGPPPEGIPAIDEPEFISVSQADEFLSDLDPVFMVQAEEGVKIYPQKILVWHEVVNDTVNNQAASITYCPLTGSTIGYYGTLRHTATTFGVSGKLLNSNLVLFDRESNSEWPQILGQAVNGDQEGRELTAFPVDWQTWNVVRESYPEAEVLARKTGFLKSYGNDPYGSYLRKNSYYDSGDPFFPVMSIDHRLEPKDVVIGVIGSRDHLAISKAQALNEQIINTTVGNDPIVVLADCNSLRVRVYSRVYEGETLEFQWRNGQIKDSAGRVWNIDGELVDEREEGELEWITSFDVMWFAWAAYYPDTELYR